VILFEDSFTTVFTLRTKKHYPFTQYLSSYHLFALIKHYNYFFTLGTKLHLLNIQQPFSYNLFALWCKT